MSHVVLLEEIMQTYYRYVKHAMYTDSRGRPLWQLEYDRDAFHDRWFARQGIEQVRSKDDGRVTCALRFRDREHYMFWLMRWS